MRGGEEDGDQVSEDEGMRHGGPEQRDLVITQTLLLIIFSYEFVRETTVPTFPQLKLTRSFFPPKIR